MSMLMYKGQIVATNANTYSDLLGKPLINDSELGVVNNAESLQLTWYGSQDEYDAIPVKNEYTLYIVLDGSEGEGSGGSANYNSLINKPAIEGITLYSNTTYDDLDLMTRTEIESKLVGVYTYRGKVETIDDLPALAEIGDIYFVEETQSSYAWNGENWDDLGSGIDLSKYQTIEDPLLMTDDITVPGAINEHELQIGELEDLKTEDKTNLVAAINELIGYETKTYVLGVTGDVDDYVSETYGVTTGMTAIDAYNAATGAAASMEVSTFAFRFFAAGISDAPNTDGYIFIESSDVNNKKIRAFDNAGREWYYDFTISDWVEIVEEIDYRFPIYVFNTESETSLIEKYDFSAIDNADNFFANAEANKVKEYCGEVGFVIPGDRVADVPTTDATALVYIKTIGDTTDKITCVADDGKWYKIPGEDWVLVEDNYDAPRYIYDAANAKLIAFLQRKNFKLDGSESSIDLYNTLVANFPYPVDVIVPNTLVNDLPTLDDGVSPVGKISICNHKDNTNLIVYSLNNEDNEYLEYYRPYDVATSTWGDWVERVYYDKAAIPTYKVVATDDDADKAVKKRLNSASILGMDVKDIYGLTIGKKFISIEVPATAVTGIPDDLTDDIVRDGDLVFVDNHRDEHSRIMYKSEDDRQWYMSIADDGTATGEWTEIVIEVVPQIYRFDVTSTTDEDYLWLNDKYSFEYSGLSVDDVYALVAAIDDREVEIAVAPADMTDVYFTNILPGDRVIFRNFGAENITYKRDSYGEIFEKVGADWTGIIPDVFDINGTAAEAIYEVPTANTPVDIYAGLVAKVLPFRPFKLTCKPDAFTDATAPYEDRDDNDSVVFQSWGAIDERITYKANNGKEWYMEVDLDTNVASGVWTRKETVLPEIHRFDIVAGSAAYNYFLDNYEFDFIGGGKSASDIVDFIEDLDKKVQVEIDATIYGADNSTPYSGSEHAGDRVIFRNFGDARITYKRVSADAIFDYGELFAYDLANDKWVTNEHDTLETSVEKLKDMYLVDADSTVGLYNELRDKVLPYRGYNIVVDANKLAGGDLPEDDTDDDKITIKSWGRFDERITYADIDGKNYFMAVDTDTNVASGVWTEIVIDNVPEVFTIDVTSLTDAGYLYLNEKYNFEYEGKTIAEIDAFVQAITDKDVEVCVVPTAVPGIPFVAKTTDRIIFRNYGIDRITYYRANYGEIVRYDLATSSWISNTTEVFDYDIDETNTALDTNTIVDEYDMATGINTVVDLYEALKSKLGIWRGFEITATPAVFAAAALPYTIDVDNKDRITFRSFGKNDTRITYTAVDGRNWYMDVDLDTLTASGIWTEIVIDNVPEVFTIDVAGLTDPGYLYLNDKYSFEYSGKTVAEIDAYVQDITDKDVEICVVPTDILAMPFAVKSTDRVIFRNYGIDRITYRRANYGEILRYNLTTSAWESNKTEVFELDIDEANTSLDATTIVDEYDMATGVNTVVGLYDALKAKVLCWRPFNITATPAVFTDTCLPYDVDIDNKDRMTIKSWGDANERITYHAVDGRNWYMAVDLDTNTASGVWTEIIIDVIPEVFTIDVAGLTDPGFIYLNDKYGFEYDGKTVAEIDAYVQSIVDKDVEVCVVPTSIVGCPFNTIKTTDRIIFRNYGIDRITYRRANYGEILRYDLTDGWQSNNTELFELDITDIDKSVIVDEYDAATGVNTVVGLYEILKSKVGIYRPFDVLAAPSAFDAAALPYTEDVNANDRVEIKSTGNHDERITYTAINGRFWYMDVDLDTLAASGVWTETVVEVKPVIEEYDGRDDTKEAFAYVFEKLGYTTLPAAGSLKYIDFYNELKTCANFKNGIRFLINASYFEDKPEQSKANSYIVFDTTETDTYKSIIFVSNDYSNSITLYAEYKYNSFRHNWVYGVGDKEVKIYRIYYPSDVAAVEFENKFFKIYLRTIKDVYSDLINLSNDARIALEYNWSDWPAGTATDKPTVANTYKAFSDDRVDSLPTHDMNDVIYMSNVESDLLPEISRKKVGIVYKFKDGTSCRRIFDDYNNPTDDWRLIEAAPEFIDPIIKEYDTIDNPEATAYIFNKLGYDGSTVKSCADIWTDITTDDELKYGTRIIISGKYISDDADFAIADGDRVVFNTTLGAHDEAIVCYKAGGQYKYYDEFTAGVASGKWILCGLDKDVKYYRIHGATDTCYTTDYVLRYNKIYGVTIADAYATAGNNFVVEYNYDATITDYPTAATTYRGLVGMETTRVDSLPAPTANDVIMFRTFESENMTEAFADPAMRIVYTFADGTQCFRILGTSDWRLIEEEPEFIDPVIKEYDTVDDTDAFDYIFEKLGYTTATSKSAKDIWSDIIADAKLAKGTRIIVSGKYVSDDAAFAIADDDRVVFNTTVGANEGAIVCYRAATNKEYYELFTVGGIEEPSGNWLPRGVGKDVKYYRIYNNTDGGYVDLKERYLDVYDKDIGIAYYYSCMVSNPLLVEYNYAANATDYPTAATTYRGLPGLEDTRVDSLPAPSTSDVIMIRNFKSENISGLDEADKAITYTFANGTKCYRLISGMIPSDDWRLIEERPVEVRPVIEEYDGRDASKEAFTFVFDKLGYTALPTAGSLKFVDFYNELKACTKFNNGIRFLINASYFEDKPEQSGSDSYIVFDTTETDTYKSIVFVSNTYSDAITLYGERNYNNFTGKWIYGVGDGEVKYYNLIYPEFSATKEFEAKYFKVYGREIKDVYNDIQYSANYDLLILEYGYNNWPSTSAVLGYPTKTNTHKADSDDYVDSIPSPDLNDSIYMKNTSSKRFDDLSRNSYNILYTFNDGTKCYGLKDEYYNFTGEWKIVAAEEESTKPVVEEYDTINNAEAKTYVYDKLGYDDSTSALDFKAVWDAIIAVPEFAKGCRIILKPSMFSGLPVPGLATTTDSITFDTTARGYECVSVRRNYVGNLPVMYAERDSTSVAFTGNWMVEPDGGIHRYYFTTGAGNDYQTLRMIFGKKIYGSKSGMLVTYGATVGFMYGKLKSSVQKINMTMATGGAIKAPTDRAVASNTYKADGSGFVTYLPEISADDLIIIRNYNAMDTDEADPAQRITYKFVDGTTCYGIIGDDGEFTGTWKLAPEAPDNEVPFKKIYDLRVADQKDYVLDKLGLTGTSFSTTALVNAATAANFTDIIVGELSWLSDKPAPYESGYTGSFKFDPDGYKIFEVHIDKMASNYLITHAPGEAFAAAWEYGDGRHLVMDHDGVHDPVALAELKQLLTLSDSGNYVNAVWTRMHGREYFKYGAKIFLPGSLFTGLPGDATDGTVIFNNCVENSKESIIYIPADCNKNKYTGDLDTTDTTKTYPVFQGTWTESGNLYPYDVPVTYSLWPYNSNKAPTSGSFSCLNPYASASWQDTPYLSMFSPEWMDFKAMRLSYDTYMIFLSFKGTRSSAKQSGGLGTQPCFNIFQTDPTIDGHALKMDTESSGSHVYFKHFSVPLIGQVENVSNVSTSYGITYQYLFTDVLAASINYIPFNRNPLGALGSYVAYKNSTNTYRTGVSWNPPTSFISMDNFTHPLGRPKNDSECQKIFNAAKIFTGSTMLFVNNHDCPD